MENLERNSKIISSVLTFIVFEIMLVSIFDRTIELAGMSKYVPDFTLALFASNVLFVQFKDKFMNASKISYVFYVLGRVYR